MKLKKEFQEKPLLKKLAEIFEPRTRNLVNINESTEKLEELLKTQPQPDIEDTQT